MLSVIYAFVAALVVGGAAAAVPFIGPLGAILPALVTLVAVYLVLLRKMNARVRNEMTSLQAKLANKNFDLAIAELEGLKRKYARWVFMLGAQIDGQIGAILYAREEFDKARPYLDRAFIRMWDAKLMLACLMSGEVGKGKDKKKGDLAAVDSLLERVVKYTPKQGMVWSTWAWLHWKAGESKKAIDILARGKQALGDADAVLAQNLLALQNDKKMKMKGYGNPWYLLHLEQPPIVMQQQRGGNVRFARR
jgi:tetratricopeptide (TPR) repeat protein